jgi:hypothetical protein
MIAGKDGRIDLVTRCNLVKLQSSAWLSNNNNINNEDIKTCSHCSKIETQTDSSLLMKNANAARLPTTAAKSVKLPLENPQENVPTKTNPYYMPSLITEV